MGSEPAGTDDGNVASEAAPGDAVVRVGGSVGRTTGRRGLESPRMQAVLSA